jgi:hypothetical protein
MPVRPTRRCVRRKISIRSLLDPRFGENHRRKPVPMSNPPQPDWAAPQSAPDIIAWLRPRNEISLTLFPPPRIFKFRDALSEKAITVFFILGAESRLWKNVALSSYL